MAATLKNQKPYRTRFAVVAENICLAEGYDDKKLAKTFGIGTSTLYKWKADHPEFSQAICRGKDLFDGENVEPALLKRALGYDVPWEEINEEYDKGGTLIKRTVRRGVKHFAPDVTAQIFWLKNRSGGRWRDVRDLDIQDGEGGPMQIVFFAAKRAEQAGLKGPTP
jgi:hypothetical protein